MNTRTRCLRILLCLGAFVASGISATGAKAEEAARLVFGLNSADQALSDLEYLVVGLANKQTSWENNVYPNLEIFLIGVQTDQPIRFDMLLEKEFGQQIQTIIPVSNLDEFLDDNLYPIDIVPERTRDDRELYELTGEVYDGWLRFLPKPTPYTVIYAQREALPKGMPHPSERHDPLIDEGSVLFMHMVNTPEGAEDRIAAFEKFRATSEEDLQKFPDETRNAFELRKRLQEHSLDFLKELLVQTGEVRYALSVDQDTAEAPSSLLLTALPETELAKSINRITAEPSRFQSIPVPENAVVSLRGNVPVSESRAESYRSVYELTRPVIQEQIAEDENVSAEEKAARQEVATLLMDILTESSKLNVADGFLDIIPSGDKHAIVLGVRCSGQDKINEVISKLPTLKQGWTLKKDADKAGDVAIHQLNFGDKLIQSFADFYGTSGNVFLATTDDAFWLAGGEGSLELLKSRLTESAPTESGKGDGVMISVNMHAQPLLRHLHAFFNDPGLDLLENFKTRREDRKAARAETSEEEGETRAKKRASELANFEWEEAAIANMEGLDDRFEIVFKQTGDGALQASGNAQKGILNALGALIAKFSDENLQ